MTDTSEVRASATEAIQQFSKGLGVRLAYGDRVELGGEQVIPVAVWAGGGGSGADHGDGGGEGAGFGGTALPIGVYVGDAYGVRFRPNLIALLLVAAKVLLVAGWALPRIIRALKR